MKSTKDIYVITKNEFMQRYTVTSWDNYCAAISNARKEYYFNFADGWNPETITDHLINNCGFSGCTFIERQAV